MSKTATDRATSVLLGLACGDALGRPVEGWSAERITAEYGTLTRMHGDGVHGRPAGTVTDDTALARCIAQSLVDREAFDPDAIAARFVDWLQGDPIGIGGMTRRVLRRIEQGEPWEEASQHVWEASPEGRNAGNGSVMRCAPLAIAYDDRAVLQRVSRTSSRITHTDPRCTHGCAVLNLTIMGLLDGTEQPLAAALEALPSDAPTKLTDALTPVPDTIDAASLEPTGYVVHTLQTALYHGLTAESLEQAIVTAIAMGGDTDTIAAITGAIAGARFGSAGLPDRWLEALAVTDDLALLARELSATAFDGDSE
jgi:ADP-ribosyl-[dinitrogen reductase] hydrolase